MKIKKIRINENEKIGNLELDFTKNGIIQDTIILAGNNGCGKTTILEEILLLAETGRASHLERKNGFVCADIVLTEDELDKIKENIKNAEYGKLKEIDKIKKEIEVVIDFSGKKGTYGRLKTYVLNGENREELDSYNILYHGKLEKMISAFYSAANIDYNFNNINSITTIDLDVSNYNYIKSSNNTGNEIKQTFIDIFNLDAQDFLEWAKLNKGKIIDENQMYVRLRRFKDAFKYIMDDLEFDKIINKPDQKEVMFKRKGKQIRIDDLSTGEKQIIIRAGFLLRFLKILQGSFILIDEPELSLHPDWQNKILQFYKKLFTDNNGKQTSQIFVATHSPFIINNFSRYNDKVIILNKNSQTGNIEVVNSPKYYDCSNNIYIQEAFDINDFNKENNILFTEGETDETYLRKAVELYFENNINFDIHWIGKKLNSGNIINTGSTGLNNMLKVLEANDNLFSKKVGLLYDCDTRKEAIKTNKYFTYTLKDQKNKIYKKGIENMLVLPPGFNYSDFYETNESEDEYGAPKVYSELNKKKLCNYVCNCDKVRDILKDIKPVIEEIIELMKSNI